MRKIRDFEENLGESTLCVIVCLTLLYLYNLAVKYITCIEIFHLVAVLVKLLSIMRLCLDQQSFHHTWCRKEYHEWEHQDGHQRPLHPHYFAFLQPPHHHNCSARTQFLGPLLLPSLQFLRLALGRPGCCAGVGVGHFGSV